MDVHGAIPSSQIGRGARSSLSRSDRSGGRAHGNHFHFDPGTHRKGCHGECRPGRVGLGHVGLVDLVDGREVRHVREKDGGLHDMGERQARRGENALQVFHGLARLRRHVARHQLAGRGVERDLARDEQQVPVLDRRRIGANGLGPVCGGYGFLRHERAFLPMSRPISPRVPARSSRRRRRGPSRRRRTSRTSPSLRR